MHPLLILVLIFDVLIAVSSVLNLVNMMRVNLLVEERKAEAFTVERVRVSKAAAGKGGILTSYFGVYTCPGETGKGEFTSTNPYGSEVAVPETTTVVPMKASGVLEKCDISAHLRAVLCRCGSRRWASRCCWRHSSTHKSDTSMYFRRFSPGKYIL